MTGVQTCALPISPLDDRALVELSRSLWNSTPNLTTLDQVGRDLAARLFDDEGRRALRTQDAGRLVVVHGEGASAIPFEALSDGSAPVAVTRGIVRRPAFTGLSPSRLRVSTSGPLGIALISDPTEDLTEADRELDHLRRLLNGRGLRDAVRIETELVRSEATVEAILDVFDDPAIDVVHFAGHGYFEGFGPEQSGLVAAGGERLSLDRMRASDEGRTVPRLCFFNACRAGRLRGPVSGGEASQAFAGYFLRLGVEAFLGTLWDVKDRAAAAFAARVYRSLAWGGSLEEAVRGARQHLFARHRNDWANYVLYGHGDLRLRRAEPPGDKRSRGEAPDERMDDGPRRSA